jgi:hypothetical protein
MYYQLPNGKVINISVEEYLSLTDEDIQTLIALNYGEYPTSYWFGSCIHYSELPEVIPDDINMMSYEDQDEILTNYNKFNINNIPDEEIDNLDLD